MAIMQKQPELVTLLVCAGAKELPRREGGKGREGKGREGKGREGKGRKGKGREGRGGEGRKGEGRGGEGGRAWQEWLRFN